MPRNRVRFPKDTLTVMSRLTCENLGYRVTSEDLEDLFRWPRFIPQSD